MIENQPNELTLIYHSDKEADKRARAFVESVTDYVVKTLDLKRDHLTETQLAEIADKMSADVKTLIDFSYRDQSPLKDTTSLRQLSATDQLTLLAKEPMLLKTPIVIIGKHAYHYASANDLLSIIHRKVAPIVSANADEKE
jgi:arsenate reductase-like glutaredoxin family protein